MSPHLEFPEMPNTASGQQDTFNSVQLHLPVEREQRIIGSFLKKREDSMESEKKESKVGEPSP